MVQTNGVPKLPGVVLLGEFKDDYSPILTPEALGFVAHLARKFTPRVEELLERRQTVQARFDAGEKPNFLAETRHVREGDWKVAPLPEDLQDRRVEITGPTDRKMVINALNSGANVYMPDFEDSNAPSLDNMVLGQLNLRDAIRRTITFTDPRSGKSYALNSKVAVMIARPRGWHLWEKHMLVDYKWVPAGVFDFGLYFFHNARELVSRGSGPYFYLPKMQSHLEARLWNDIFLEAQSLLSVPAGTVKATVLIETLPAAFEMDEILYELRQHSAGLNCGRWDYIFSFIKTRRADPKAVMPDRAAVGMTQHCMRSYTQLVIRTCHRRGVHAMGGMAAQIPIKDDPRANEAAMAKVLADKEREVRDGHDGTWVAHPGLLPLARRVFDQHMRGPNQVHRLREDVRVTQDDLLQIPTGPRTVAGLRSNISVGILYIAAWLGANGCVPIHNLMEDAATAEISRTQIWQWVHHGAVLDDGQVLTQERFDKVLGEEVEGLKQQVGADAFSRGQYKAATQLFRDMCVSPVLKDFLTLPAYDMLLTLEAQGGQAAKM